MPPSLYIALRFISHRKKAIVLSLTGVILGVAFYICAQAQTQGFERFFVKSTLGTSGAVIIGNRFQTLHTDILHRAVEGMLSVSHTRPRKIFEGINDPERMMRVVNEFSNVAACAPVLEGNAALATDFRQEVFRVQGIDMALHLKASSLREQIVDGSIEDFQLKPFGLILGYELADKMRTKVGQDVGLIGPDGEHRTYRVCAVFQTGNLFIDEKYGYIHLKAAQSLLQRPYGVSQLMVKLRDPSRAQAFSAHIEQLFQHRARSWQDRERGSLQIFRLIRISAAITVSTIILLAGFGIFNILTLMVMDKVREIAVLRSMGYQRGDISAIFLWQGFLVALIGSVLGCVLGAALTYGISQIPVDIRGFLSTKRFLVHWNMMDYWAATVIAFVAIFLASYFPSRRAARLAPVDILRGSGQ
ncbi:MAG: ABC transporter permease [Verrucomicrobia bacterium]|nr:ABC transporter permease [Verrucomicrobiota bacterium]